MALPDIRGDLTRGRALHHDAATHRAGADRSPSGGGDREPAGGAGIERTAVGPPFVGHSGAERGVGIPELEGQRRGIAHGPVQTGPRCGRREEKRETRNGDRGAH